MTCDICNDGGRKDTRARLIPGPVGYRATCHLLDCGHAWHRLVPIPDAIPGIAPPTFLPTRCNCPDYVPPPRREGEPSERAKARARLVPQD